jgi:CRP-like cAMP-binding protein
VPSSCFADRLGELIELTPSERRTLAGLEERERPLRRGAVLRRESDRGSGLFILKSGMMMSYTLLDDGSRQILRFLVPGDLFGISGLIYRDSPETLAALTDCIVCPFERSAFGRLMVDHPRLAAMVLVYSQIERAALTDRLAALGRTSAKARVAAVLLDLRNRREAVDTSIDGWFLLGLTQEEIGDATGLTAVHVNRMFRQLEEEGLIARENGRVTFTDEQALARTANYADRYKNLDLSWLPEAR